MTRYHDELAARDRPLRLTHVVD